MGGVGAGDRHARCCCRLSRSIGWVRQIHITSWQARPPVAISQSMCAVPQHLRTSPAPNSGSSFCSNSFSRPAAVRRHLHGRPSPSPLENPLETHGAEPSDARGRSSKNSPRLRGFFLQLSPAETCEFLTHGARPIAVGTGSSAMTASTAPSQPTAEHDERRFFMLAAGTRPARYP